jgi:hypothetical protein
MLDVFPYKSRDRIRKLMLCNCSYTKQFALLYLICLHKYKHIYICMRICTGNRFGRDDSIYGTEVVAERLRV